LPILEKNGITYAIQSFWSLRVWSILFNKGYFFLKATGLLRGLIRRLSIVTNLFKYDCVFIYREAAPIGPPVFEWLIAKIWRKKIIYDFDDAIWLSWSSVANPQASLIKCSWKVKYICKYSTIISVGNRFLADYAKKFTEDVRIIPTVVDTEKVHHRLKNQDEVPLTIGWTGTFTNFYFLDKVTDIINELKKKYDFNYLIISNKDPQLKNVEYSYKEWNLQTEITDLLSMHIGIMPLYNEKVALGKCAFKAIQYMSLGIPPVVSPIGANCEVVKNGETGFWAETDEQWYNYLEKLISDKELRIKMGMASQKFIIENYSVKATTGLFLNLFKESSI
jgi:glycosyltransferase involved in cell wall biosynthesis